MVCLLNLSVHGGHLQTILQQIFSTYIIIFHPSFQVTQKTSKKKKKNKNGFISHVLHHQGVGDLVSLFCVLFCGYTICYFSLNNIKKKYLYKRQPAIPFFFFCCRKFSFSDAGGLNGQLNGDQITDIGKSFFYYIHPCHYHKIK